MATNSTSGHESEAVNVSGAKAMLQKYKTDISDKKYVKPSGGIPKTDLASAVQSSLGKADSALQSHQTIKQDGITGATVNRYGVCPTAAATAEKTVSVTSGTFNLETGASVRVKFTNSNTADTPTLNVNSKGAKSIFHKGSPITAGSNKALLAGVCDFVYDGTQWHLVGNYIDTNTQAVTRVVGYTGDVTAAQIGSALTSAGYKLTDTTYSSQSAASGGTAVSLCTTGEKYTWNSKQNAITDGAVIGSGLGTCSTAAATAAKTATLSNYVLLKNMPVSIFFQNGINVADATLNINSKGAKPIFISGSALQPGVVRPRTTVTFVYDGTNYNIIAIGGLEQSDSPDELWIDMGLPSGLKWAKRNIDLTQANKFAASEYQYECSFFSWGNVEGHNPANTSSFSYNWGTINAAEPWYDGQVYGSTRGNELTGNIAASQDAARVNLGAPWRMPTAGEFAELLANIDYINANDTVIDTANANKLVTMNDIVGIRIKSKVNGNVMFFPCCGRGNKTVWTNCGSYGLYWSSSFKSTRYARNLFFDSGGVGPQDGSNRFYGYAVRAVL